MIVSMNATTHLGDNGLPLSRVGGGGGGILGGWWHFGWVGGREQINKVSFAKIAIQS